MPILAYHLIWTTYGTWLPGDRRGWVKKKAVGIQPPDKDREQSARDRMAEPDVTLSLDQRAAVEQTILEDCSIREWILHAAQSRSNHVHVVVTAHDHPDEVMKQLKAWCSRKLSDRAGLHNAVAARAGRRRWFTESGDKEIIEDELYLENAIRYVLEGQ